MTDREEALEYYKSLTLKALLNLRFYGSYVPGVIEKVIFEKIDDAMLPVP